MNGTQKRYCISRGMTLTPAKTKMPLKWSRVSWLRLSLGILICLLGVVGETSAQPSPKEGSSTDWRGENNKNLTRLFDCPIRLIEENGYYQALPG